MHASLLKWNLLFSRRQSSALRSAMRSATSHGRSFIEPLEERALLSESASAQLNLVSTTGTVQSPVYNYNITLTNTGTTNVGTFWCGWIPGEDFLPSFPSAETSPAGWGNASGTSSTPFLTGAGNSSDGTAIQWVAQSLDAAVTPGHSLSGFTFSTTDTPATLAGGSSIYSQTPVLTSFVYAGGPESDAGFRFVVTPAQTLSASTTTLGASNPTINVGDSVTLTATVAPTSGSGATPTGTVTFMQGSTSLGSVAVGGDGAAVLSTSSLPAGSDSINVVYGGDSTYAGSTSPTVIETVNVVVGTTASAITLVTSNPTVDGGSSVTFTATVAPLISGGQTPTGTVAFSLDGTSIGDGVVQNDGIATLATSSLAVGVHTVLASYAGDSVYAASASGPVIQTIVAPPTLVPTVVKSTVPSSVVGGLPVHGAVVISITNESGAAIKGKTTIDIFSSSTGMIDGSSTLVGRAVRNFMFKAGGKPKIVGLPIRSLPALANTYTLLAQITDPSSNINAATTGPSVQVAAPFIALSEAFTRFTLAPSVLAGARTPARAVVQITNNGNVATPRTTTVAIYLSANGIVDVNSTLIRAIPRPLRIRPGKFVRVLLPLRQIPAIAAGTYSVLAQVTDPDGQITAVALGSMVIVS